MSDCVYWAFAHHTRYLGIRPRHELAWPLFRLYCLLTGGTTGLYIGCAPLIIKFLAQMHGLEIARVEHLVNLDRGYYVAGAENTWQRLISRSTDFGQPGITPCHKIRFWLGGQHAYFGPANVLRLDILTIELRRKHG